MRSVHIQTNLPLDHVEICHERLSFHLNVVRHFSKLVVILQDLVVGYNLLEYAFHYFVLLHIAQNLPFSISMRKLKESWALRIKHFFFILLFNNLLVHVRIYAINFKFLIKLTLFLLQVIAAVKDAKVNLHVIIIDIAFPLLQSAS